MRQSSNISGGSASPLEHGAGQQSLSVWTGVQGTTLTLASLVPLVRVASPNTCSSDGVNSICFDQPDRAFNPGVLAFARVITADRIGVQIGSSAVSTEVGQILDADIRLNLGDSLTSSATPQALGTHTKAYHLESILIHELRHAFGFSYSAVWSHDVSVCACSRNVLYVGSIQGHIIAANPISLPAAPPGVTGVFGTHVVAVDATSGSGMPRRILAGHRCKVASCLALTPRSPRVRDLEVTIHDDRHSQ